MSTVNAVGLECALAALLAMQARNAVRFGKTRLALFMAGGCGVAIGIALMMLGMAAVLA